ncbi:MAG: hypothetical protein LBQ34_02125 [Alphaproteobacteria bacterium]|jgi:hypothetical protein|nr:hypothetical protein [Alphaproteobacteria bacterium]
MRFIDLKFLIVIAIIVVVLVATVIYSLEKKNNLGLFNHIPFLSKKIDPRYKQACVTYVSNVLSVRNNLRVEVSANNMNTAEISRMQIAPKTRASLADDSGQINVMVVNVRLSINDNPAFNLTCWINEAFNKDPNLITSYDILFANISSINKTKSSFSFKEENY